MGWNDNAHAAVTQSGLLLTADIGGGVSDSPIFVAYQWYRDAAAIAGATHGSYTLTSADYERHIWVRETVSKAGDYTTVIKDALPINYSVHAAGTLAFSINAPGTATVRVGAQLTVSR